MAQQNNTQTWNISMLNFHLNVTWNGTVFTNPSIGIDTSTMLENVEYFTNLPIYIQRTLLDSSGKPDTIKILVHFNSKANEIISEIVRNRKVLQDIAFSDLPLGVQTSLQNSVYQTMENMLKNSFYERTTGTSIQTDGLTIDTPISATTKISEIMGRKAYTTLINSNIHYYDYDSKTGKLYFRNDVIYAKFKSGEALNDVVINGVGDDSLLTRKEVTSIIGNAVAVGKTAILSTADISQMIETYDEFIKASVPTSSLGNVVDISYVGIDPFYINPNIVETYVFDGAKWLIITSNALFRQSVNFFTERIIALEQNAVSIDKLNDATTQDDAELIALEGMVIN